MTKHEIPEGCFGYLIYESDETFDMMSGLFLVIPMLTTLILLILPTFQEYPIIYQIGMLSCLWISCVICSVAYFDMR
jgi:hypothetical protein